MASFVNENFIPVKIRAIVDQLPNSDATPEALCWADVANYKATNDPPALGQTGQQFKSRYRRDGLGEKGVGLGGLAQPATGWAIIAPNRQVQRRQPMRQTMLRMALIALCAAALTAAYHKTKSSTTMAGAAHNFLASLSTDQKAKATFAMENEERTNWHFIPRERKGLPLKEMDGAQRALAEGLLSAGLSQRGYMKATTIMSLEKVLKEIETDGRNIRDPERYFFSVFGDPSDTATWGWRVEGHHVSLNFTIIKGQTVADSPSFFGANPAEVKKGPRAGLRALAREEDLARELLLSLDAKQKAIAVIDPVAPKDILSFNKRKAEILENKGIAAAKLNKKQSDILMSLLEEYAGNMPEDLATARMDGVRKAGMDKIVFAWAGGPDRGQGHYYRVQGPTFLVEYDDTQNDANHIHSVWRDFNGDFGADLLAMHYQQYPHRAAD